MKILILSCNFNKLLFRFSIKHFIIDAMYFYFLNYGIVVVANMTISLISLTSNSWLNSRANHTVFYVTKLTGYLVDKSHVDFSPRRQSNFKNCVYTVKKVLHTESWIAAFIKDNNFPLYFAAYFQTISAKSRSQSSTNMLRYIYDINSSIYHSEKHIVWSMCRLHRSCNVRLSVIIHLSYY